MNLTYTVQQMLVTALSKIGIDGNNCEPATLELAHRTLNLMLGAWSADPDMAVQRIVPTAGYANLSDTVDLPVEYCNAIVPTLAVMLQSDFDQPRDARLETLALEAVNLIKTMNIRRQGGCIPTNKR